MTFTWQSLIVALNAIYSGLKEENLVILWDPSEVARMEREFGGYE